MPMPKEKRQVIKAINAFLAELPPNELAEIGTALLWRTTYASLREDLLVALADIGGKPEEHREEQAAAVARRDGELRRLRELRLAKATGASGANRTVQTTSLGEAPHGHA